MLIDESILKNKSQSQINKKLINFYVQIKIYLFKYNLLIVALIILLFIYSILYLQFAHDSII